MITAQTRVSDALSQRPELRDILPAFHPMFERLRHPVLGRVLPRLVTVADAARIAGVDLDALVAVMNLPAGAQPPVAETRPRTAAQPAPAWLDPAREVVLDVRPILDRGEEPMRAIFDALRGLSDGEVLTVLAPFEPVPLVGLLARQGWAAHIRWEGDRCHATFGRGVAKTRDGAVDFAERLVHGEMGWVLDVRGLEPPEPMRLVLAAIEGHLPLLVLHHREPSLLLPLLAERGLTAQIEHREDRVEIRIDAG